MDTFDCAAASVCEEPFIYGRLPVVDAKRYITHVMACKKCYRLLTGDFALLTAVEQLDNGLELSDDYDKELLRRIVATDKMYVRERTGAILRRVLLCLLILWQCLVA